MFSFFRRTKNKDTSPPASNGVPVAVVNRDKLSSVEPTSSEISTPPNIGATPSSDDKNNSRSTNEAVHITSTDNVLQENGSIMAPMAAIRGKNRRKQPEHQNNNSNKQQSPVPQQTETPSHNLNQPKDPKPPKQPQRHKALSYANILRRLDSVPPMNPPANDQSNRRHSSVKPCSHVTVAAATKPQPLPSPPKSNPVAIRNSRPNKNVSKTSDPPIDSSEDPATNLPAEPPEANTVTAAMELRIDLLNPPVAMNSKNNSSVNSVPKSNSELPVIVEQCKENGVQRTGKEETVNIAKDTTDKKRNLVNQETQFQTQLAELSERLRVRDVEASELRVQIGKLDQDLYVKSSGMERLQAELVAAHKDSEFVRQKLKHLQDDVQQYRQKNSEMVEELQKKTDQYKTIEETSKERTVKLESSIQTLTEKLSTLETQLNTIREERDSLEQRKQTLESEREEEKRIVQEALDAASAESEVMRRRWEQDFEKLRTVNTDREQQMFDDFEWKLREVHAACKKRLEEKDKVAEQKIKEVTRDVDTKIKFAEQQLNEALHLKSYEAEVTQLRGLTHDQQYSLKSMSSRVEELQATEQNLKEEIVRLHSAIDTEKVKQYTLTTRHEKDLADKERALQIRLEKQKGEVAVQWEQKLRQECARLTNELEQMHNDEKQMAVELVKVQKDSEFDLIKKQWERKLQQHLDEIEDLKSILVKKENKFQKEIERLQTNTDRDIMELRRELDKTDMSYHERVEKMLADHEAELDKLNEEADRKMKELEQNCQMQVSSMRATLELVKEQAERESYERIQRLEEEHRRANDELWRRLTDEKEKEVERIEIQFKQKFEKIKEQFTIVQKNHLTKESELLGMIEKLKGDTVDKTTTIESLQGNVDTLHGGVQVLRQEIVHQDQLINKVKTDAEQKIGELQQALKIERDNLQSEREERLKEITLIQKQAQGQMEQLQRRCQCLTKLFEDMRARYDKRESRPEDLNVISDLRTVIAEQERDLAILNEEKRYFQMKLMEQSNAGGLESPKNRTYKSVREKSPKENSSSTVSGDDEEEIVQDAEEMEYEDELLEGVEEEEEEDEGEETTDSGSENKVAK